MTCCGSLSAFVNSGGETVLSRGPRYGLFGAASPDTAEYYQLHISSISYGSKRGLLMSLGHFFGGNSRTTKRRTKFAMRIERANDYHLIESVAADPWNHSHRIEGTNPVAPTRWIRTSRHVSLTEP